MMIHHPHFLQMTTTIIIIITIFIRRPSQFDLYQPGFLLAILYHYHNQYHKHYHHLNLINATMIITINTATNHHHHLR